MLSTMKCGEVEYPAFLNADITGTVRNFVLVLIPGRAPPGHCFQEFGRRTM